MIWKEKQDCNNNDDNITIRFTFTNHLGCDTRTQNGRDKIERQNPNNFQLLSYTLL